MMSRAEPRPSTPHRRLSQPHERFRRIGRYDLLTTVAVPLADALLGGAVPVRTLSGEPVTVHFDGPIPCAGAQQVVKLEGMPIRGTRGQVYTAGDLIVRLVPLMPTAVRLRDDDARRALLRNLLSAAHCAYGS